MSNYTENELAKDLENQEYKFGFVTDIEADTVPIGLNEDIIRLISFKKNEPEWLLNYRLKAFAIWQEMTEHFQSLPFASPQGRGCQAPTEEHHLGHRTQRPRKTHHERPCSAASCNACASVRC